jgi:hypothetical protein
MRVSFSLDSFVLTNLCIENSYGGEGPGAHTCEYSAVMTMPRTRYGLILTISLNLEQGREEGWS